jgi:glycosyltransferase involved in cell wall biosynthesis
MKFTLGWLRTWLDTEADADRIAEVWADPKAAAHLRSNAADLLRLTYTWDAIAVTTVDVYRVALG